MDNGSFQKEASASQILSQDITLYAKWTQKTYTISFVNNGHGENLESLKDVTAVPEELPVLTEEGWSFEGWYLDNESFLKPVELQQKLTGDLKLYAKWSWVDPDSTLEGYDSIKILDAKIKKNLSVDGYAQFGIEDFKIGRAHV